MSSLENSCVWYRMTEAVLRLVGKITPPCPLDSYWRTSAKSDILSGGVMANRPHQSIIYRITDANTPGAQKTEGSLWEVHIAQISLQTWSGRRGGGLGLVKFSNFLAVRNQSNAFEHRNYSRISSRVFGRDGIDRENIYLENIY